MFSAMLYFGFWAQNVNTKVTKPLCTGAIVVHIHVVVLKPSDMVNSHIRDYGMTDGGCQNIMCKHCPVLLSDKAHIIPTVIHQTVLCLMGLWINVPDMWIPSN
jgi:hypothetical protein